MDAAYTLDKDVALPFLSTEPALAAPFLKSFPPGSNDVPCDELGARLEHERKARRGPAPGPLPDLAQSHGAFVDYICLSCKNVSTKT